MPAPMHAAAPALPGAPALALSSASDAPDFHYSADFPAQRAGKGRLFLKILLGLLLVAGTATAVVVVYPLLTPREPPITWPAAIVVRSDPPGLEVFDSGTYVGDTPVDIELPGPSEGHEFRLVHGQKGFTAKAGGRAGPAWMYIKIPAEQAGGALGVAEIISDPPDAQVRLGETEVGRTPLIYVAAPGEKVSLVVTRDGATQTIDALPTEAGARVEVKLP